MSDEPEVQPKPALSGVKGAAVTTAQVFMNPKAFLNWRAWFLGLYSSAITAGATAMTTWMGSNGIEGSLGSIPLFHNAVQGVGISWKSAVAMFFFSAIGAAMKYISQTKGLPPGVSSSPFSLAKNHNPSDS